MTTRTDRFWRFTLFAALAAVGCGDAFEPEDGSNLEPLNSPIIFQIREFETGNPPETPIMLRMITEAEYGCSNYWVDTDVAVEGRTINVVLNGVREPVICLTAVGPAYFAEELNLLNGSYDLRIVRGRYVDKYEVNVTDSTVEVIGEPGEHSRPGTGDEWDRWEISRP